MDIYTITSIDNFMINKKDALRYLGFGNHAPDDMTLRLVDECVDLLYEQGDFRAVRAIFPLEILEERLCFAGLSVESCSLLRNLSGCEEVLLFGATLGVQVDRLIERFARMDLPRCMVMQACAAAVIESFCDALEEIWKMEMAERDLYLRPRFSPGYGDFPLAFQKDFVRILDAPRKIGLTLTDSLMLVPVKSVTALIGCSSIPTTCHKAGCESCQQTNCPYRRN